MIKYSIFDPNGNITALVETHVDKESQAEVADEIMKAHSEVEQLGFVFFDVMCPVPTYLRMAGGEFCGNATMSAAALYLLRSGEETESVRVRVAGVSHTLTVKIRRSDEDARTFEAGVEMPATREVSSKIFESGGIKEDLPIVMMQGISHIIIEKDKQLYAMKDDPSSAEAAIKAWCAKLDTDCLGLMFLDESKDDIIMTPLVYVPGADTIFWESSCASGTSAVGMYISKREKRPVDVSLTEPGGVLRVTSDAEEGITWLYGTTKLIKEVKNE